MFLINRNFRLLWFGQSISQLGDKAYNIALMWWLFEKTASPLYISSFLIASMLPELIFGPVAGVYIDRWDKKKILVAADFVRGIAVLLLAVLYLADVLAIWHIYSAALCISLCSALFNPATMAVIPAVVEKAELRQANALSQLVAGAVAVIGPLVGASSVALLGYAGVLVFNGCSYMISGLAAAFLRMRKTGAAAKEPVCSALLQGLRYIRRDPRIVVVVIIVAVIHVFVGAMVVVMPFLAGSLTGGINSLGVLQAALGGGIIAGAVYVSRFSGERLAGSSLFCAIMVMGAGIAALGALQFLRSDAVEVYAGCCLIIGMCVAVVSVFWRTIAQTCVAAEMTGRVFSVLSTTGNITLPVSIGLFGVILHYAAPAFLLSFAGICLVLIGIVLLISSRTMFENLQQ